MKQPPTHVYDWLDQHLANPPSDPNLAYAVSWLDEFTRPAVIKNLRWLRENKLFVQYKEKLYRCTGASRLGDVWLTEDFEQESGYSLRVNVDDLSGWQPAADTPPTTEPVNL